MVKYKNLIFVVLITLFLGFSFYPTYFELQKGKKLADPARTFILEHNYYWPDYNLYLSKIRQGMEGRLTAIERYTSEKHEGSLIQIFYVWLGYLGKIFLLTPNNTYLLGRILLSITLLTTIVVLVKKYFRSFPFQVLGFLIIVVSGSFPYITTNTDGTTHVGRYMEWWSNIDALQRITFIPHILFGQIVSFLLFTLLVGKNNFKRNLILSIIIGNILGFVFPPSLMTIQVTLIVLALIQIVKRMKEIKFKSIVLPQTAVNYFFYAVGSLPSLLYTLALTQHEPWATLVSVHRNNHFLIPFGQFILATGPVFYLGLLGSVLVVLKREKRFLPWVVWIIVTSFFLIYYTYVKDQSPLRFTQTGLFIPLGILSTYFLFQILKLISDIKINLIKNMLVVCHVLFVILYVSGSIYMMSNSMSWQLNWISQRIGANVPPVPYPPQAMYPLTDWLLGIQWLDKNTPTNSVVLSEVTAGNYIPGYTHNIVFFGQANTVDYDRKQADATRFFSGKMSQTEAKNLLDRGRINYVFESIQEREKSNGKPAKDFYPFLKTIYTNPLVTIYSD